LLGAVVAHTTDLEVDLPRNRGGMHYEE